MASAHAGYSSDATSHGIRPPVPARSSATDARVRSAARSPTARPTTDRPCGSSATWSRQSPTAAAPGSPLRSSRPANDHFPPDGTSPVVGGKSRALVVPLPGVIAGGADVAGDGVPVDADRPGGLAGADAPGHVFEPGGGGCESGVEQGRALAFGGAGVAGATAEQAGAAGAVPVRLP